MTNFWDALELVEQPVETRIEYRLYYNEDGSVQCYSMEDLEGNYIVVDEHLFNQFRQDLVVKNGEVVVLTHDASFKLVPSNTESYGCHPEDVSIVVENDYPDPKFWSVKTTHEAN